MKMWNPCEELTRSENINYAVLILNTPIELSFNRSFINNLWNNGKVRLTVDGGTHRWWTWLQTTDTKFETVLPPDLITGDMDSLPVDVLHEFHKHYSQIQLVHTPDQNEPDFAKALKELNTYSNDNDIMLDAVYVLGDSWGRFDQIMTNINTLFKTRTILGKARVYLIAATSLTWLLEEGHHTINIPLNLRQNSEWCSLIPIGAPCLVSTSGLKWNLKNAKLEFGGLISTSNTYSGDSEVTIETDGCLIWSMGMDFNNI